MQATGFNGALNTGAGRWFWLGMPCLIPFRLPLTLPLQVGQWQVVAILFLKALSLERCPALREAFETRDSISRMNRLLGALSFTSEELYALLELLCPAD